MLELETIELKEKPPLESVVFVNFIEIANVIWMC